MSLQRRLLAQAQEELDRLAKQQESLHQRLEEIELQIAEARRIVAALGVGSPPPLGVIKTPEDDAGSADSDGTPSEPIEAPTRRRRRRRRRSDAEARDWIVSTRGAWFSLNRLVNDGYGVAMRDTRSQPAISARALLDRLIQNGAVEESKPDARGRTRFRYIPREEAYERGMLTDVGRRPPRVPLVGLEGGRSYQGPVAGTGGRGLPKHIRELLRRCRPDTRVDVQGDGHYVFVAMVDGTPRRVVASGTPRNVDAAKRQIEYDLRKRRIIEPDRARREAS